MQCHKDLSLLPTNSIGVKMHHQWGFSLMPHRLCSSVNLILLYSLILHLLGNSSSSVVLILLFILILHRLYSSVNLILLYTLILHLLDNSSSSVVLILLYIVIIHLLGNSTSVLLNYTLLIKLLWTGSSSIVNQKVLFLIFHNHYLPNNSVNSGRICSMLLLLNLLITTSSRLLTRSHGINDSCLIYDELIIWLLHYWGLWWPLTYQLCL